MAPLLNAEDVVAVIVPRKAEHGSEHEHAFVLPSMLRAQVCQSLRHGHRVADLHHPLVAHQDPHAVHACSGEDSLLLGVGTLLLDVAILLLFLCIGHRGVLVSIQLLIPVGIVVEGEFVLHGGEGVPLNGLIRK